MELGIYTFGVMTNDPATGRPKKRAFGPWMILGAALAIAAT